jgi:hypothetical protein
MVNKIHRTFIILNAYCEDLFITVILVMVKVHLEAEDLFEAV